MRACKCAWQLETGELVEEEVFLPDGARIDRVIHHQAPPLILPSLPYPSLLSHPITVQEPHEPKPVLQGPPKRHQEAQELRVQVPQGGKCLLARVSLSILFSLILRGGLVCDYGVCCVSAAFVGATYACSAPAADGVTCGASSPPHHTRTSSPHHHDESQRRGRGASTSTPPKADKAFVSAGRCL